MDLIDLQIMSMNKNSVTLQDFKELLKSCVDEDVDSILRPDLKVYFPEGKCGFDEETLQCIERVNELDPDGNTSPVICLSNGTYFFILRAEGEQFVNQQWSSITSLLLGLKARYEDVKVLDAQFNDEVSYYLIRF